MWSTEEICHLNRWCLYRWRLGLKTNNQCLKVLQNLIFIKKASIITWLIKFKAIKGPLAIYIIALNKDHKSKISTQRLGLELFLWEIKIYLLKEANSKSKSDNKFSWIKRTYISNLLKEQLLINSNKAVILTYNLITKPTNKLILLLLVSNLITKEILSNSN
jgi:hypothetical protein